MTEIGKRFRHRRRSHCAAQEIDLDRNATSPSELFQLQVFHPSILDTWSPFPILRVIPHAAATVVAGDYCPSLPHDQFPSQFFLLGRSGILSCWKHTDPVILHLHKRRHAVTLVVPSFSSWQRSRACSFGTWIHFPATRELYPTNKPENSWFYGCNCPYPETAQPIFPLYSAKKCSTFPPA